jgi:hypothetical protein
MCTITLQDWGVNRPLRLEATGPLFLECLGPRALHSIKIYRFLLIFSHDTQQVLTRFPSSIIGESKN